MIESSNYSYRQIDCFSYCTAEVIIQNCNLTNETELIKDEILFQRYVSSYSVLTDCIYDTYFKLADEKNGIVEQCSPQCPLECDSVSYSITSSFSNDLENMKEGSISLIIQYNTDMKYTKISELPKTSFKDLVSNVGGMFGLFIGISFLDYFL